MAVKPKALAVALGFALAVPVGGLLVGGDFLENLVVAALAKEKDKEDRDGGKSDSGKSDSGKSDSGKSDSGKSDSGKSDSGKSDSGKPSGQCEKREDKIKKVCAYSQGDSGKGDSGNDSGDSSDSGMDDSDRLEEEIKSKEEERCKAKCRGDSDCESFCEKETRFPHHPDSDSQGDSHEVISKEEIELGCQLEKLKKEKIEYDSDEPGQDDSGKSDSDLESECTVTVDSGECHVDSDSVGSCVSRCKQDLGSGKENECKALCKEIKKTECKEAKKRKKKLECKIEKRREEVQKKACEQQCKVLLCNDKCDGDSDSSCHTKCEADSDVKEICQKVECPEIDAGCEPSVPRKRSFKDNYLCLNEDRQGFETALEKLEGHLSNLETEVRSSGLPNRKKEDLLARIRKVKEDRKMIEESVQTLKGHVQKLKDHVQDTTLSDNVINDLKRDYQTLKKRIKRLRNDAVKLKEVLANTTLANSTNFEKIKEDVRKIRRTLRDFGVCVTVTENDNQENKKLLQDNPSLSNKSTCAGGFYCDTPPGGTGGSFKSGNWQQLFR